VTDWEKRVQELFGPERIEEFNGGPMTDWRKKALQLGREMADERAEEIARLAEKSATDESFAAGAGSPDRGREYGYRVAATFARSFIYKKRTREEVLEDALRKKVLEDALRKIEGLGPYSVPFDDSTTPKGIAKRALEWKEGDKWS
jgi:hypothetical protein